MNYVEIPLKTGEVLIVDEDDYEKVKEFTWITRLYHNKSFDYIIICRSDNKQIRFHKTLGYGNIPKGLSLAFLNGNIFDYRKENVILQRRYKILGDEERKRKRTSYERKKESKSFKNEISIPENGCVIQNARKRDTICLKCDLLDNVRWYRCLNAASYQQWTQWKPKEMGEWCLKMLQILSEETTK